jgi:hypothetical protein
LLSSLSLPSFGRENWQSNIRHYVNIHEDYADMPDWRGTETSDLVYQDESSSFTNLLIENGYLPQQAWTGKNPKYYIEVKTTTTPLSRRLQFYVSQVQYDRMEAMILGEGNAEARNEVYLIARVFGLGSAYLGVTFYVDPARQRRLGVLDFRADKYQVTPLLQASAGICPPFSAGLYPS